MRGIGAAIAKNTMHAIGRCTSNGVLNTSRIASVAGTTTIMVTVTTIGATIMVMDATAIGTMTMIGMMTISEAPFTLAI
jgi:hypothetical protein